MSISQYDLDLIRIRFREVEDELYRMKRKMEDLDSRTHRLEDKCQVRSSSSQESSTPTLPESS